MNKEAAKKLAILKKELKKKIFIGVSKAYNYEVVQVFQSHPFGVGYTLQYFKPITVSGNTTQDIIAHFSKGYPAVLQLGPQGSKSGYVYPYGNEGTFVSFEDEPELEEWARKNYKDLRTDAKGLVIGKMGTTGFGKPYNRWVTKAGQQMKAGGNTREVILSEIRSIKL